MIKAVYGFFLYEEYNIEYNTLEVLIKRAEFQLKILSLACFQWYMMFLLSLRIAYSQMVYIFYCNITNRILCSTVEWDRSDICGADMRRG